MLSTKYKKFAKWVIYQIYPKTFCDSNNDGIGDLNGVISKLDYIKSLGVNAIWLSPFFKSPMKDNGYDIEDYLDVNPIFGTKNDFKKLIKEAHKKDIKIIVDFVGNHTSNKHKWFKEALKSKKNPYHSYYYFFDKIPNDWKSVFGGSAYTYVTSLKQYYLHSFCVEQPDLNWDNPKVRKEMQHIIDEYVKLGVDGFRCDVLDMVSKDFKANKNGGAKYIHKYIQELFSRPHLKDIFVVGECWSTNSDNLKLYTSSDRHELTCSFQNEINKHGVGRRKFDKLPFRYIDICKSITKWQNISSKEDILYTLYYENHDNLRVVTHYGDENKHRYESATMLAAMLYLTKGVSFIYQGQELGLINQKYNDIKCFNDIETINYYKEHISLGKKEVLDRINFGSRDNTRRAIPWSDKAPKIKPINGLDQHYKEINVNKDLSSNKSVIKFYQSLFKLRNSHEVFQLGNFKEVKLTPNYYIYERSNNKEKYYVVINFDKKTKINIKGKIALTNYLNNKTNIFNPYEIRVLKIK